MKMALVRQFDIFTPRVRQTICVTTIVTTEYRFSNVIIQYVFIFRDRNVA